MEFTFFAALAGAFGGFIAAGLWAGVSLVGGFGMPSGEQVAGLALLGTCGLPVVGWLFAVLNP